MPEKIIGTLTSRILKSVHTSISLIIFCNLCSVAIPERPEPFSLGSHVRIVALMPDVLMVSFCSITSYFSYRSITELLTSLILSEGLIRALRPPYFTGNHYQPCGCCGVQIHARSPDGSVPRIEAINRIGLE